MVGCSWRAFVPVRNNSDILHAVIAVVFVVVNNRIIWHDILHRSTTAAHWNDCPNPSPLTTDNNPVIQGSIGHRVTSRRQFNYLYTTLQSGATYISFWSVQLHFSVQYTRSSISDRYRVAGCRGSPFLSRDWESSGQFFEINNCYLRNVSSFSAARWHSIFQFPCLDSVHHTASNFHNFWISAANRAT